MEFRPDHHAEVPHLDLLSWLFADVEVDREKPIFIDTVDESQRLNIHQAVALIRKLIAGLRTIGLKVGDAVCLHAFNHILYSSLYLGIVGAGGCVVGSNPAYASLELEHLLQTTNSKYIIIESDLLDKALPAILSADIPASHIFVFSPGECEDPPVGLRTWEYLLQHGEQDWIQFNNASIAKSTAAALLLTSGTTGLPKAAVISHYAHVAVGVSTEFLEKKKPYDVSYLLSIPQFHSFSVPFVHIAAFRPGRTIYIMRRFDPVRFAKYIHRYQITDTAVVPPMLASLVDSEDASRQLASLRVVYCAGSPLSPVLHRRILSVLHSDAVVTQVWGMTETGWISTFCWPEKDVTGSVGRLVPNMEARVIDGHGNEALAEGVTGEIYVRGPTIMNGYLANPTATADALQDGWLKTGDIGYFEGGKIYIVDRSKELIKVRGWQVSPSELEATLLLHPAILDVAVVGVAMSDEYPGDQLPRAYVVVRPGQCLSERDVEEFVACRMARYKALDGGVVFVTSIPRNGSGKILRRLLSEKMGAERIVAGTVSSMAADRAVEVGT
ncbi:related to acyl-CoA synthetase [Ramularia collo-cygni]|uniref:Related to acyl-CoA synthetase n=1 Tax=Ramularia collo-cygni TaxID=112498 RepID=A0A2D3V3G2_9PEZI|nr:related to acyl-CoA synthetase [Ramularia collo-cygni]CZT20000.1 related to acyl-CoA synthetase [Ramularia collo-cygni]